MAATSPTTNVNPPDTQAALAQNKLYADLYRFYVEWLLKLNTFYYTVTGALLGYVLAHLNQSPVRFALLVPVTFSAGLLVIFVLSVSKMQALNTASRSLSEILRLKSYADFSLLKLLATVFAVIHAITLTGLLVIVLCPSLLTTDNIQNATDKSGINVSPGNAPTK